MRHDPALGRALRRPRLARFGLAANRPVLILGFALAALLLALVPGRLLLAWALAR